jgi:regulator of cell morphogenesis and NO signaling
MADHNNVLDPSQSIANRAKEMSSAELIELILERFHKKHVADLANLVPLARKVTTVHASHPSVPFELTALLELVEQELVDHLAKEEQILFPWILSDSKEIPNGPITVMLMEHASHEERVEQIREMCHGFVCPPDACRSWKALYDGLRIFVDDLVEHIEVENNVLFPMVLS